jgi:hypothetical protein
MIPFNINIIECSNLISTVHITLHKLISHFTRILRQIVIVIHYVAQRIASTERQNDKINRLKQLVVMGQPDEVGESVDDAYQDLAVYSVIAQLVSRGKWAK